MKKFTCVNTQSYFTHGDEHAVRWSSCLSLDTGTAVTYPCVSHAQAQCMCPSTATESVSGVYLQRKAVFEAFKTDFKKLGKVEHC